MSDKLKPQLSGVPETMLWPLHNRAAEARRSDALLHDPESVRIADAIDYDYERSFGKPDIGHVMRAVAIDQVLRTWLEDHPDGWIAALGEGLDTQTQRVDNGRLHWLSIDLPESIQVRELFIPNSDRHRNVPCSALDFRWMEEIPANQKDVMITAAGLLMYFSESDARGLIAAAAARFPCGAMVFDTIPRWISRRAVQGWKKTRHYTTPPMPFGINRDEMDSIRSWHPNIAEVVILPMPRGRNPLLRWVFGFMGLFPRLRALAPAFVLLKFRPAAP